MASQNIQNLYETALKLLRRGAVGNLKNLLQKLHSADVAQVIGRFDEKGKDDLLAMLMDSDELPNIFAELGSGFLESYLKRHHNYGTVAEILQKLPSDDRADLIGQLPEEMSKELLARMKTEQSREVTGLLQYQETTAGGLMSTEVFKLNEKTTVAEAVHALQNLTQEIATVFYIYVVDNFENLTGVISIKQLFQVDKSLALKDIMLADVVRVKLDEPQKEVARLVAQYDLVAIPVVDDNNKLSGVITVDDIIDVIQEEAAENVLKMGSAETDVFEEFNFIDTLKNRLFWFLFLLTGGIITWEVIYHFYRYLPTVGVFAGVIPMLLRFGGIVARQTSTILIQGISTQKIRTGRVLKFFLQQGEVTLVIALILSSAVASYAFFRFGQFTLLPLAVGVAIFSSMLVALTLGIFIPLAFQKAKLNPVWATGTPINFLFDVIGLLIYFKVLIAFLGVNA